MLIGETEIAEDNRWSRMFFFLMNSTMKVDQYQERQRDSSTALDTDRS